MSTPLPPGHTRGIAPAQNGDVLDDLWYGTATPHLSMAERIRVAEFDAAPEPPEIVVERVARAIYDRATEATPFSGDWEDVGDRRQELYRRLARAAIAAMRGTR